MVQVIRTLPWWVLALAMTMPLAGGLQASGSPAEKPNIVFFFVDDMGWQDTSVPFWTERTALNRRYRTPHMSALAREGMKFTQAYACAVCSPSRISLMTGLNAVRHRVTNWTLRMNQGPDRDHPVLRPPAWNLNGLAVEAGMRQTVEAITLPMLLGQNGYRTIHVGKAHFAADGTPAEDPRRLGFDINIAGHCAGGPGSYHGSRNFSAAWRQGDRIWDVPGLEAYHGEDIYLTEALTLEAIRAVRQAVRDGQPFYLYLSHYAVHAPWEEDPRFLQRYLDQGIEKLQATYAAMIEGMDKSLGDIMAALQELGVDGNTILVFMTDNGCPKQLPRNDPLRGHKLTPYEGGTRVPMIVKWPGVVKPESICSEDYLIIEDIFPTFLDMAGVQDYQALTGEIDGRSFVPLLRGSKGYSRGRPLFWHFPHTYDQPAYSAVRQDDWKLIYFHATRKLELYNLARDIGERQDQSGAEPEVRKRMARLLSDFLRSAGGQMPTDKRTGTRVEFPDEITASDDS